MTRRSPDVDSAPRARRAVILYLVAVVAILGAWYAFSTTGVYRRAVSQPFSTLVAALTRAGMRGVGLAASGSGRIISSGGFAVEVRDVCNGLDVIALFSAAVLAFPTRWRRRLRGFAVGALALLALNVVRVAVLVVVGRHDPGAFEKTHYVYAQVVVVLATAILWLAWLMSDERPPTPRAAGD